MESLGLFPLHTVLVPGAALDLRVFEARYLDLVRECGRNGRGFGVCMLLEDTDVDGGEAGAAATPAAWGTEARIEDFVIFCRHDLPPLCVRPSSRIFPFSLCSKVNSGMTRMTSPVPSQSISNDTPCASGSALE